MPGAGIEPAWRITPGDFKSPASTCFAIRAGECCSDIWLLGASCQPPILQAILKAILKAIGIFREHRYGALPVLDKTGALVGILSAQDLLLALEELLLAMKSQKPGKKNG